MDKRTEYLINRIKRLEQIKQDEYIPACETSDDATIRQLIAGVQVTLKGGVVA